MRTTVLVDDELGRAAQERARREGISFSAFVARAIAERVARLSAVAPPARPFRLITVAGGPRPGVNLDRVSDLVVAEDAAQYGDGNGGS